MLSSPKVPTSRHKIPRDLVQRLKSQRAVLAKHLPPSYVLASHRGRETAASLLAALDSIFETFDAVERAHRDYEVALVARTRRIPEALSLATSLKVILTNVLGLGHPALDAPGLRPHGGLRKLTVKQKYEKVERAKLTLKAQGRLTKAQKKRLKFTGQVAPAAVKKPGSG